MPIVKGENMILSINSTIISCWRSCSLNITTETVGISTIGSGNWTESEPLSHSYNLSAEGQVWVNEAFTVHDLIDLQMAMTPVIFSFDVDSSVYYVGEGTITNTSMTGNVNDIGSFNVDILGTGELYKS